MNNSDAESYSIKVPETCFIRLISTNILPNRGVTCGKYAVIRENRSNKVS